LLDDAESWLIVSLEKTIAANFGLFTWVWCKQFNTLTTQDFACVTV
jgi:hypothetical protein